MLRFLVLKINHLATLLVNHNNISVFTSLVVRAPIAFSLCQQFHILFHLTAGEGQMVIHTSGGSLSDFLKQ
jgi:hypothetical protein